MNTFSLESTVSSIAGFKTSMDYIIGSELEDFILLVTIGGNSWSNDDEKLLQFIKTTFQNNFPLGAICGAVDYLARNGFLNNHNHTVNSAYIWNDYENYNPNSSFHKKQAIKDKKLEISKR